jgi:hypothetical protein
MAACRSPGVPTMRFPPADEDQEIESPSRHRRDADEGRPGAANGAELVGHHAEMDDVVAGRKRGDL